MLEKKRQTRIMVFGTFDGLHDGHLDFFACLKKSRWPSCKPSKVPKTIILVCLFFSNIHTLYQTSKGFFSTSIDELVMFFYCDNFLDINLPSTLLKDYNVCL